MKEKKSTQTEKGKGIKCKLYGHISRNKRELKKHRAEHSTRKPPQSTSVLEHRPSTSSIIQEESNPPPADHSITCRKCREVFPDRKELCLHQKIQHQTGEGISDGQFPWEVSGEPAPWDGNEKLERVYKANRNFITDKTEQGAIKKQ